MAEPASAAPLLLTAPEAAKRLGICIRTLQKEVAALRLRYVMIGRSKRYVEADLIEWLNKKRAEWDATAAIASPPKGPAPRTGTATSQCTVIGFEAALKQKTGSSRRR